METRLSRALYDEQRKEIESLRADLKVAHERMERMEEAMEQCSEGLLYLLIPRKSAVNSYLENKLDELKANAHGKPYKSSPDPTKE